MPTNDEITRLVTHHLAQLLPADPSSRRELRPLLTSMIGEMRDEAAGRRGASGHAAAGPSSGEGPCASHAGGTPAAPPPGGGEAHELDQYQERAAALQIQTAKMQMAMSVAGAIADLIKTVGSKIESAAARG
jgi:hypothetical protein